MTETADFFRCRIDAMNKLHDPLAVLAGRLPWALIEQPLAAKFGHDGRVGRVVQGVDRLGARTDLVAARRSNAGRPRRPIRLMASLLALKPSFNLSDGEDSQRWNENALSKFFSGPTCYEHRLPCDATQIGLFRRDVG